MFVLVAAAVAVPASWGRYTAQTQVQAQGRVASWDVQVTGPTDNVNLFVDGVHRRGDASAKKLFTVTNNSEVAADITLWLAISADPNVPVAKTKATIGVAPIIDMGLEAPVAGVIHQDHTPYTWRFEPGVSAVFFIQLNPTTTPTQANTTGWYREFRIFADAVQVD